MKPRISSRPVGNSAAQGPAVQRSGQRPTELDAGEEALHGARKVDQSQLHAVNVDCTWSERQPGSRKKGGGENSRKNNAINT
jgi:hypothetical protein